MQNIHLTFEILEFILKMSDLEGEICYDIDVEDEEVEFNSFLKCCQKFNSNQFLENIKRGLSWVLTNIGLICVVVCYCLLGALTFRYVEQENELEVPTYMPLLLQKCTDAKEM